MTTSEIIKIQIGEEIIELTGAEKETFLADREAIKQEKQAEAEAKAAKEAAKAAAQEKLTALGLTVEDLQALGL